MNVIFVLRNLMQKYSRRLLIYYFKDIGIDDDNLHSNLINFKSVSPPQINLIFVRFSILPTIKFRRG